MPDIKNGEKVARGIYDWIIENEDVELYYSDNYYDFDECWRRMTDNALINMLDGGLTVRQAIDLVAWATNDAEVWDILNTMPSDLIAERLQDKYVDGWSA